MPRIRGFYPDSITEIPYGGGQVPLASGGMFYPPGGDYLVWLGGQTCLQHWDPIGGQWQEIGNPNTDALPMWSDGCNWRLVNMSGVVTGTAITNSGSGGTNGIGATATGVSVVFTGPGVTGGVTALGYAIVGGSVPIPSIVAAGGPFLTPPVILCDPPPLGGVQATFTCTLNSSGGIASIVAMNNGTGAPSGSSGAGYASIPNFYVLPQTLFYQGAPSGGVAAASLIPPGVIDPSMVPLTTAAPGYNYASAGALVAGAKLTGAALTGSGTLTGIVMYVYGSLYTGTTIPSVGITGCGAAAATALMSMCMTGSSSLVAGSGYSGGAPIWETSLGLVAGSVNNNDCSPLAASGTTTLSGSGVATLVIEQAGFGFQKVPQGFVTNVGSIATAQSTFTPVCGGVTDWSQLLARST